MAFECTRRTEAPQTVRVVTPRRQLVGPLAVYPSLQIGWHSAPLANVAGGTGQLLIDPCSGGAVIEQGSTKKEKL